MAQVKPATALQQALQQFHRPDSHSHKGQNGRLLVIGGSQLFHAAVLWSAEIASHFVDMVHFCSTQENQKVFLQLKSNFRNGIIIAQKDLFDYVEEDDCILIGPGMMREGPEADYARETTYKLLTRFPNKKFVIDGGALQVMNPRWLLQLSQKAVLTPHRKEFQMLFGEPIETLSLKDKKTKTQEIARKYNCVILLKTIVDIISDGEEVITIEGGNAGLSKGGSGDTLSGLTAAFVTTNDPVNSCILASYILKSASEQLFKTHKTFFNTSDLIAMIPTIAGKLIFDKSTHVN